MVSSNSSEVLKKETKQNIELNEHTWIEQSLIEESLEDHGLLENVAISCIHISLNSESSYCFL